MALSDTQVRQLRAKLDERHVKTRKANGIDLHYVEGWHVISEANRIFGYDAWDRRTLEANCVTSSGEGNRHAAAYTAKVRVTVRAGETLVVREGSGTGEGFGATTGQAHDIALKSAETDATKRALATFGNPFGLALYDREQLGVRRCKGIKDVSAAPWILRGASGEEHARYDKPSGFALGLREALSAAQDIEGLFAVWERNVDTVRAMNRSLNQNHLRKSGAASQLVAHLKRCAVALAKPPNHHSTTQTDSGSQDKHWRVAEDRQERAYYWSPEANSLQRASPLRLEPAMRHLWKNAITRPPCALRATTRIGAQGQRRVHRAPLRHSPPTASQYDQGTGVVAGAEYRSLGNCP